MHSLTHCKTKIDIPEECIGKLSVSIEKVDTYFLDFPKFRQQEAFCATNWSSFCLPLIFLGGKSLGKKAFRCFFFEEKQTRY